MSERVSGLTAVVTGAGSGIGFAAAARLLHGGAHVVALDCDWKRAGEMDALGGQVTAGDVTSEAAVKSAMDTASESFGSIDILVNAAGIAPPDDAEIVDTELDTWQRVLSVNLTGTYLCCKHALRHMLEQRSGAVVNIASLVSVMGTATSQISYTASKGGIVAMSRELAVCYARRGVRVNCISPGVIRTPMVDRILGNDPRAVERRMVHVPMGHFGTADEVAAVICFLASREASYVTGVNLLVDGGVAAAYVTPEEPAGGQQKT